MYAEIQMDRVAECTDLGIDEECRGFKNQEIFLDQNFIVLGDTK